MNQQLQTLSTVIQESPHFAPEEKAALLKTLKDVDKELEIALFKLDRTEKVKRTTAILLEETIEELENKRKAIEETNAALSRSLEELKAAQTQLIQSEKMASLGELTAGIAHEIQNPLNFVNNFSEVSAELLDEMKAELASGNTQDAIEIAEDIKQNLLENTAPWQTRGWHRQRNATTQPQKYGAERTHRYQCPCRRIPPFSLPWYSGKRQFLQCYDEN